MTSQQPSVWEELARKFPKESIGVIPRKGGINLPYVGHATVTERLNRVLGADGWEWRPCTLDKDGIPFFDPVTKTYWWALTINGTTRYGMGEGPDPKRGESDALKRAGMRFGIALDMWAKD